MEVLSPIDSDEHYDDKIIAHEEKGRNIKNWAMIDILQNLKNQFGTKSWEFRYPVAN
jgi:hypothetical protein